MFALFQLTEYMEKFRDSWSSHVLDLMLVLDLSLPPLGVFVLKRMRKVIWLVAAAILVLWVIAKVSLH